MTQKLKRSHLLLCLAAGAAALAAAQSASAGTFNGTINVTSTVVANCTVTTNPLAFGNYTSGGAAVNGTTTIGLTCTNSAPYTISLDQGGGTGATVTTRIMSASGGGTLNYSLYQDTNHTTVWGTTGGALYSSNGTGSLQTVTVYGQITGGQTSAPGSYSDTVNVVVSY